MEWRSIESAPTDGTPVLVYAPEGSHNGYWWADALLNGGIMWVACYSDVREEWQAFYVHSHDSCKPTHWMPLPVPPAA